MSSRFLRHFSVSLRRCVRRPACQQVLYFDSMSRRPTIADVARRCGVTPATVSYVLNGKDDMTSAAMRKKVNAAVQELGYAPDLAARNLNRQQTRIIGLFAPPRLHVSEGLNEAILEGASYVLQSSGYEVFFELPPMIGESHPMPFWRFDGAILMEGPRKSVADELDQRQVPYVSINSSVGKPLVSVLSDDAMGMNLALDYLAKMGHKRFAYANARPFHSKHYSVVERHEALVAGARRRKVFLSDGHETPFEDARRFVQEHVVDNRVTAVITYDHQLATFISAAALEMKLEIPRHFSLLCFNDVFPVMALFPAVTAIAVNGKEMGRIGSQMLLEQLSIGKRQKRGQIVRIEEKLIIRASTVPPVG